MWNNLKIVRKFDGILCEHSFRLSKSNFSAFHIDKTACYMRFCIDNLILLDIKISDLIEYKISCE